jgi:hypothetical protein
MHADGRRLNIGACRRLSAAGFNVEFRRVLFCFLLLAGAAIGAVIRQNVSFSPADLKVTNLATQAIPELSGCDPSDDVGAPLLAKRTVFVPLPEGSVVQSVKLVQITEQTVAENFLPAVVQPQAIIMDGVKPKRVEANALAFTGAQPYPADVVKFAGQGTMAGKTVAMVTVYPLRYVPDKHELTLATNVEFEVEYEPGEGASNVERRTSNGERGTLGTRSSAFVAPGQGGFQYLVVTNQAMDSVFQQLADWKTEKGIKAVVRDIAWIEASYPGRDSAERLRNYLKTCYPDSGLKWLLLGGDVGIVPLRYAYAMTCSASVEPREDSLPCDLYYSDLTGDWDRNGNGLFGEVADSVSLFPDIYVGRAPANNPAQARVFVNKVLTYERNPPLDYETRALFCGMVLWQDPYTDEGVAKDMICREYVPPQFDPVIKLYQSQGTENLDTVTAEINRGCGFYNHDGHGSTSAQDVGGWPYFYTYDMDALTNAPRYGICYSIGCWTGAFDLDCVGEHFVLAPNGGGVAYIGNSSYGWGSPGNPGYGYSDRFDAEFYHQVFSEGVHSIGQALALTKVHFIPYSREANVYRWHQYELNLLGDPEMPLWTDRPRQIVLTVPPSVPAGPTRLQVTARDSSGAAIDSALVCAQESGVYATAWTNLAGQAALDLVLPSSGSLRVTVTAPNFLPETCDVPSAAGPCVVPHSFRTCDSTGNNDGIPNPGEDIYYQVTFRNDGSSAASGLHAVLRTSSNALMLQDTADTLPQLKPGDSAVGRFLFAVRTGVHDRTTAFLELAVSDSQGHAWTYEPAVVIGTPVLTLQDYLFTDSAHRGAFAPGDTLQLILRAKNSGLGFAYNTHAHILPLDTSLLVFDDHTLFGAISPDSSDISDLALPVIIQSFCPPQSVARLMIVFTSGVFADTDTVSVVVGQRGLNEDCETGAPGWTHSGAGDEWHLSTRRSHSPNTSFYCGNDAIGRYSPSMDCWLLSPRFCVEPGSQLSFWLWYNVPIFGADGVHVVVERDSGGVIIPDSLDYIGTGGDLPGGMQSAKCKVQSAESKTGDRGRETDGVRPSPVSRPPSSRYDITSDWLEECYDLSRCTAGETLQVRFGFKSDTATKVGEGFYIDDISVAPASAVQADSLTPPIPLHSLLEPNYPNPFNRSTSIVYALQRAGRISLDIYSVDGRRVRRLVQGSVEPGYHVIDWPGIDDRGRRVPAGVYLCQLRVPGVSVSSGCQQKLVLWQQ